MHFAKVTQSPKGRVHTGGYVQTLAPFSSVTSVQEMVRETPTDVEGVSEAGIIESPMSLQLVKAECITRSSVHFCPEFSRT